MILVSSLFIIIANKLYENLYVEKIKNKNIAIKFTQSIIFIYYIILLFNMVIFARYQTIQGYNLVPFHSIISSFQINSFYSIAINIFVNFLVFMPLQYFMLELFRIRKFFHNLLLSFLILLFIKIFQYIFHVGIFDIDDIILSVLGMQFYYFCHTKFQYRIKNKFLCQ